MLYIVDMHGILLRYIAFSLGMGNPTFHVFGDTFEELHLDHQESLFLRD